MINLKEVIKPENKWLFLHEDITTFLVKEDIKINLGSIRFGFVSLFFLFYGLLKLLALYLVQKNSSSIKGHFPRDIVAITSADHMHKNYFDYVNKNKKNNYIFLEPFNKKKFTKIFKLSLSDLIKELFSNYKELSILLGSSIPKELRKLIILNTANYLSIYSYYCCLFKKIKMLRSDVSLFSGGAELLSHAANKEKVKTFLLNHGLIGGGWYRKKEVMYKYKLNICNFTYPDYNSIYVYSEDEKQYLINLGLNSEIKTYPIEGISNHKNEVIIFLDLYDSDMKENQINELVDLFISYDYEITIKEHPSYQGELSKKLCGKEGVKLFADKGKNGAEIIKEILPRFSVSWVSTAICESLNLGVIPICMAEPEDGFFPFIVYPIKKRSYLWERDSKKIKYLLKNIPEYQNELKGLKAKF